MEEQKTETRSVCVTGAGGFISSWLVKLLLSKGYKVHGTVRDPSNEKNAHLKELDKATENLQLFKADLLDYSTVEAAISGCEGVFHVASPVILSGISNPEDWYSLSKTMAEKAAFKHAQESGLDVVTFCPSIVFGPLLQSTVNLSSLFLLDVLKGSSEYVKKDSNWHFVDVRDVVDAVLLIYEKQEASGRYICSLDPIRTVDLFDMLKNICPGYKYPNNVLKPEIYIHLGSEKLKKIGWKGRTVKESISDSIQYYKEAGLLNLE